INEIRRFLGEDILEEEHSEDKDVFTVTPNGDDADFYYDTEPDDPDWTDEDDGKLLIFLDGGWGIEAMAEYFFKTPDEIFQRLKDLGMIRKPLI
ncbi:MAG: hypothetical protein IJF43_00630, partial [Firmicutes bacterium]|nr:hypothetical protein [Bacillota bacterium]